MANEREKTMDYKHTSSGVVAGTGCNTEGVDFQMENEQDSLPEKFEQMSKQSSTLDVRLSDLDEVAYGIHKMGGSDSESEGRVSVEEEAEGTTKPGEEDERFDLVTKQGMDKLKEFLAGTKGETLFSFWLQVELWKSVQGDGERTRLLHHPRIYKYIHKVHHEWTSPTSITAVYAHPVEHILSNIIPVLMGPLIMGSHVATGWLWFALAISTTLVSHCGYHLPLLPSPEAHDFHHQKFTQCFGVLGVLDWLHGTDTIFRNSRAYERHVFFFNSTPMKEAFPDEPTKGCKTE